MGIPPATRGTLRQGGRAIFPEEGTQSTRVSGKSACSGHGPVRESRQTSRLHSDRVCLQLLAYPDPLPLHTVIIDLSGKVVDSAAIINTALSIFAPRGATIFRFYTAGVVDLRPMGSFGGTVQDLSITSHIPYNLAEGVRRCLPFQTARPFLARD